MQPLPPIPTPPGQRWRDFRMRGVPAAVFLLALAAVAFLWNKNVGVPAMVGEAETVRADVTPIVDGTITELNVERFQEVTAGDPIAVVAKSDPDTIKAQIAAIASDLRLMRARMTLDVERNTQNYAQLRLDLMTRKLELVNAKILLQQAESELQRAARLYEEKLLAPGVSLDGVPGYEVALRDRDALRNEVELKSELIAELETTLQSLKQSFPPLDPSKKDDPVNAAIEAQEGQIRLMENPVILRAPISGMVSFVYHRAGERILAGAPVVAITALHSDNIIGYVRQPLPLEPKIGMEVQIRTRGSVRYTALSKIVQVGAEMQMVAAPLRIRGLDPTLERGLPILIRMPDALKPHLHPGELVDLRIVSY